MSLKRYSTFNLFDLLRSLLWKEIKLHCKCISRTARSAPSGELIGAFVFIYQLAMV
jgi:hypothetical protein